MTKPVHYSATQTTEINLGNKVIHKYPTSSKSIDIGKMVVNGRHPEEDNAFILEHECFFVMYILKGTGVVYAGDEVFSVKAGDTVFVPPDNKFAVEGIFEYITVDTPAFYPEQSEEIIVD